MTQQDPGDRDKRTGEMPANTVSPGARIRYTTPARKKTLSMTLDLISTFTADPSFRKLDADAVVLASEMHDVSHYALEHRMIFETLETNRKRRFDA